MLKRTGEFARRVFFGDDQREEEEEYDDEEEEVDDIQRTSTSSGKETLEIAKAETFEGGRGQEETRGKGSRARVVEEKHSQRGGDVLL